MATRNKSLEDRGIILPKNDAENKLFQNAASERGGIVFVSEEARKEFSDPIA